MGHAANTSTEIKNPGPFQTPGRLKAIFIAFALIGIAGFAAGLMVDAKRTWFSFVHNHFFFMSLGLGGIFFASTQWLTGAMWSTTVRRVAESFTAYLPIAFLATAILYFGLKDIYIWTDPAVVKGDLLLEPKSGYLSIVFFMVRNLIALGAMIWLARKMVANSLKQDQTKDPALTQKNVALSPAFLAVFAIGFTMASFDQLMSIEPHWFSTMFGVYCFAGLFYSVLALLAIVVVYLKRKGALEGIVNDNHLHDCGKFMFAFTVFWAYIGFSQFMLIWYANLPEETFWFIARMSGGWFYVSVFLLLGKFLVPFVLLLPRDAKRNESVLTGVGWFMLVAQWIDVYYLAYPKLTRSGPTLTWIEPAILLGFAGIFGLAVFRFLARNNVVAIGDPKLADSVFNHHQ